MERNFETNCTNCTQCTQCRNFEKREELTFSEYVCGIIYEVILLITVLALIFTPIPLYVKPFLTTPMFAYIALYRIIATYFKFKKINYDILINFLIKIAILSCISFIIWLPINTNIKNYILFLIFIVLSYIRLKISEKI